MPQTPHLSGFEKDDVVRSLPATVQVYVVGGAVRDALMGRVSNDRDWVVVGATVGDMHAAGFTPVGADFPVFLHPVTKEEYALARTERKSGHGYKGFTFHADPAVRLEDDLMRRDFTINAMAMAADGQVHDPHGGLADLQNKVFRHVSPAFSEDPLRVLRLARFLARFVDFDAHPDTLSLCIALRSRGELQHLVPERVFAEIHRGLAEAKPARMIRFLSDVSAWPSLIQGIGVPYADFSAADLGLLDALLEAGARWSYLLGYSLPLESIADVCRALRVPNDIHDLAVVVGQCKRFVEQARHSSEDYLALFASVDVYRKPERLQLALQQIQGMGVSHSALAVLQRAIEQQMAGHYKAALRAHLASNADQGVGAQQLVQGFKAQWVQSLLI